MKTRVSVQALLATLGTIIYLDVYGDARLTDVMRERCISERTVLRHVGKLAELGFVRHELLCERGRPTVYHPLVSEFPFSWTKFAGVLFDQSTKAGFSLLRVVQYLEDVVDQDESGLVAWFLSEVDSLREDVRSLKKSD